MSDAAEEQASHCDVDHGLGNVEAGLVIAHQPAPTCHPSECALDDPPARQNLEARLPVETAHNFQYEVSEGRLVEQPRSIVGDVGEQVLEPRPSLSHSIEDRLCPGTVGDVRRDEVDHQQSTIGVDGDVALSFNGLLVRVIAAGFGMRCLDGYRARRRMDWPRVHTPPDPA